MKGIDKLAAKVNHADKVIVISYGVFMQGQSVNTFDRWGAEFISWLSKQKHYKEYKIVINQSSEPLSNAGMPSIANKYIQSYKWVSETLKGFDVYLITDSYGDEFDNWIREQFGWKHLTYRFHFDTTNCLQNYINRKINQPNGFERDIFTCNGNMSAKHRILVKNLWTEMNFWEKSYWSFNESSNFGDGFLDVRLDLFGIWNLAADKLEKCFLHLITETVSDNFYTGTKIRMDFMSKMGRALSFPRPFIAYGNMGLLKRLKELGFQTFDKWWDESYDDIEDYGERILKIKTLILELNKKTQEEKLLMWNEMYEVFQHNVNLLKNISYNEKRKVDLEIPNFFNNFKYETLEYMQMDEFNIGNLCVFYDKKFDGGGTTFGYNAITKPDILERIKDSGKVLEICSGPGFIGYTLLKRNKASKLILSDINLDVASFIQKTNQYNKFANVQYIHSDCFDSIDKVHKFDTIVSNPPHFKTERPGGYRSDEEQLISLDLDMAFHKKFFEQVGDYLNPGGKIVLIENCDGVTEDDIRMLSNSKFGVEVVDYNSYGWEGKSTFYTIILYLL
jgi:hypothetical protein